MEDSASPRRLGRYEILGTLAEGGMAELFVARLTGIEGFAKRVVVKRVLPDLARERDFVEMFLEEACLAATLDHQNIVHVHDIGRDGEGFFFAMELLHGGDVAQVMRAAARGGGLPLEIALEIGRGACAGLHHAHERCGRNGEPLGLVHRDVSPQNLFVTFDGAVKLLDFGIAKAVHRIRDRDTRTGALRGKLPYMAPEHCRGEVIDRRSDIFSLSVVLWEMTVGARLYGADGEPDFEVLKAIVERDAPPPSSRRPGYPPELEQIVLRGLRRDRAARYQTADELAADLEAFIRARSMWVSARELAAFMACLFPDQAAARRRAPELSSGVVATPDRTAPHRGGTAALSPPSPTRSMRRKAVLAIGAAAGIAAALGLGFALGRGGSEPAAPAETSPTASALPPGPADEDDHWFQPNDYLISTAAYEGGKLGGLRVAKLLRAPGGSSGRGLFLDAESNQVETAHYWQTRVARPEDLVVGALAFCMVRPHQKTAPKPRDKQQSRTRDWMISRVAEVADVERGTVSVGGIICPVAGTRVVRD